MVRKVLQVGDGDSVVRDEIEAVDICGDLLGRGENLGSFLDLLCGDDDDGSGAGTNCNDDCGQSRN